MALLFVVMVLATARLTRIVIADVITSGLRTRIFARFPPASSKHGPAHPLGQLIDCAWCTGWWVAGGVVLVCSRFANVPVPLVAWPAVAYLAGLIEVHLDAH